jgi:GT2 family glycosyltransferase
MPPFFSVIVVNWNRAELLAECLDSLRGQTCTDFETIVVDNGSQDGSREVIDGAVRAGTARAVFLPRNTGFAGGANAGIRVAHGQWLVLLNNDAKADPGWLTALAAAAARHPAGMLASKILEHGDSARIDNVGHLLYPDGLNRGHGRLEADQGQFDTEREALFPSGCAAAYSRTMLDRVGVFEDSFFAYGDDTDLGLRGRLAGFGCVYVPAAVVRHRYSGSSDPYSELKAFHVERNRILVLLRCFPLREVLLSPFWTVWRHLWQLYGMVSGRGAAARYAERRSGWSLVRVALRAYWGALRLLPPTLRARRRIQSQRQLTPRDFRGLLCRFRISARELSLKD